VTKTTLPHREKGGKGRPGVCTYVHKMSPPRALYVPKYYLTRDKVPIYSGLYDFSVYRSPGNQKNVRIMYQVVRRNTPDTASSCQPQTTNKRTMAVASGFSGF
jgi:hypothetical protein